MEFWFIEPLRIPECCPSQEIVNGMLQFSLKICKMNITQTQIQNFILTR